MCCSTLPACTAAQATNEADRLSILADIGKTIGVDRLNNLIREALVDSTKHEVEQLKASASKEEDNFQFHYFSALNKVRMFVLDCCQESQERA